MYGGFLIFSPLIFICHDDHDGREDHGGRNCRHNRCLVLRSVQPWFLHRNYHNSRPYARLHSKSVHHAHAVPSGYSPLRDIRLQRRRNRRNNHRHDHNRSRSDYHEYDILSAYIPLRDIRLPRRRNRRNNRRHDRNRSRSDHHGCAVQCSHSPQLYKVRTPDPREPLSVHDVHEPIQALPSILPPADLQNHMPIFFSSTLFSHLHELSLLSYKLTGVMSRKYAEILHFVDSRIHTSYPRSVRRFVSSPSSIRRSSSHALRPSSSTSKRMDVTAGIRFASMELS